LLICSYSTSGTNWNESYDWKETIVYMIVVIFPPSSIPEQNRYLHGRKHGNCMKTSASSVLVSGLDLGEAIQPRLTPPAVARSPTGEWFGWTAMTT
jgi:hypothetical protein